MFISTVKTSCARLYFIFMHKQQIIYVGHVQLMNWTLWLKMQCNWKHSYETTKNQSHSENLNSVYVCEWNYMVNYNKIPFLWYMLSLTIKCCLCFLCNAHWIIILTHNCSTDPAESWELCPASVLRNVLQNLHLFLSHTVALFPPTHTHGSEGVSCQ